MTHIEEIYKFLLDENESTFQNYLTDNFEINSDELLIKNFWQSLEYYFDDNRELVKKFINNEKLKLPKKLDVILNYPSQLKKFINLEYSITELSDEIIAIMEKDKAKIIHPLLFIFCYKQLSSKLKILKIENKDTYLIKSIDNYIVKKKKTKAREQYSYTFSIFYHLFTNDKLDIIIKEYERNNNLLFANCLQKIYLNFKIEVYTKTDAIQDNRNGRFNDICIDITNDSNNYRKEHLLIDKINKIKESKNLNETKNNFYNYVLIEINENAHLPSLDEDRKISIFEKTGKLSNAFIIKDDNFKEFMKKIYKEISSILFNNYDKNLGIIFYLCCYENFNYTMADFFLNLYNRKDQGIKFNEVIKIFKGRLKNENKFIKLCFEELDDDDKSNFLEYNNENPEESILSSVGVDIVITLPRKKECSSIIEIKECYTKFREGYFTFLNESLDDNYQKYTNIVLDRNRELRQMLDNFILPAIEKFYKNVTDDDKEEYKLSKNVPILKYTDNKFDREGISTKLLKTYFDRLPNFRKGFENIEDGCKNISNCKFIDSHIFDKIINKK